MALRGPLRACDDDGVDSTVIRIFAVCPFADAAQIHALELSPPPVTTQSPEWEFEQHVIVDAKDGLWLFTYEGDVRDRAASLLGRSYTVVTIDCWNAFSDNATVATLSEPTRMVDAATFIDGIRQKLLAMAEDPPYRFQGTQREDAARYRQRSTTFNGYPEAEVRRAEEHLGVRFPSVFRAYLLLMGRALGDLFRGSDRTPLEELESAQAAARRLLAEHEEAGPLPSNAVILLFHQGYTFTYLLAAGGYGSPVFQYVEGEQAPKRVAPGFADLLTEKVGLMEEVHHKEHASGGHWVKVWPDGGVTQMHGGERRALDGPDEFVE